MHWDIFSIGDANMLVRTLNGLAAITTSADYRGMIRLGLLTGLFLAVARIWNTGRLEINYFFAGFLMYLSFFSAQTATTVQVEDAYSGRTQVVANVPLGVAMPMSLVSRLGHWLTAQYEAGFGTPEATSMLTNGYGDAPSLLVKLRDITPGAANSNDAAQGDLRRTVINYLVECVLFDVNGPEPAVTRESLAKATDLWAEMGKSNFSNVDLLNFLPGDPAGGQQRSCADTYLALDRFVRGDFNGLWNNYLKGIFAKQSLGSTATDQVRTMLDAVGMSAQDAGQFMRNALFATLFNESLAVYQASNGSLGGTIMMTQGLVQRNAQWQAERSFFERYARPSMAFIEIFVAGLAPLIAFLLCAGPQAFPLALNYFKLVMWVSLWPPLMAIANSYTHMGLERQLADLVAAGINPFTMGDMDLLFAAGNQWLGTAHMLAAATPALALMLVWGGTTAVTNLAGRLQGTDTTNEKLPAPDVAAPAPGVSIQPGYQANANIGAGATGFIAPGLENTIPKFNYSHEAQTSLAGARQLAASASQNYAETTSRALGFSGEKRVSQEQYRSLAHAIRNSDDVADSLAWSTVQDVTRGKGLSRDTQDRLAVGARANAGGGLNAPLGLLRAGFDAALSDEKSLSQAEKSSLALSLAQRIANDRKLSHAASTSDSRESGSRWSHALAQVLSEQERQDWSRASQENASAQRMLAREERVSGSGGLSQSLWGHELAERLYRAGLAGEVHALTAKHGLEGEAAARADGMIGYTGQLKPLMGELAALHSGSPAARGELFDLLRDRLIAPAPSLQGVEDPSGAVDSRLQAGPRSAVDSRIASVAGRVSVAETAVGAGASVDQSATTGRRDTTPAWHVPSTASSTRFPRQPDPLPVSPDIQPNAYADQWGWAARAQERGFDLFQAPHFQREGAAAAEQFKDAAYDQTKSVAGNTWEMSKKTGEGVADEHPYITTAAVTALAWTPVGRVGQIGMAGYRAFRAAQAARQAHSAAAGVAAVAAAAGRSAGTATRTLARTPNVYEGTVTAGRSAGTATRTLPRTPNVYQGSYRRVDPAGSALTSPVVSGSAQARWLGNASPH